MQVAQATKELTKLEKEQDDEYKQMTERTKWGVWNESYRPQHARYPVLHPPKSKQYYGRLENGNGGRF